MVSRRLTTGAILALALFLAVPAAAESFRTSLSFSFADDNLLRDAGETRISSPTAYFGQSATDQLEALDDGTFGSSKLHMMVYGKVDDIHPNFVPEGAIVLALDPVAGSFRDNGTYLKVNYFFTGERDTGVALEMFPIDSDRMRLGFHHEISWGGSDSFPKHFRKGLVPGMKLQLDLGWMYAFVGAKTAQVRSPTEDILDNPGGNTNKIVERTVYGFLGGLGVEPFDWMRFEVNGGYFRKGTNTRENVLGKPIHAAGFSGQLSFFQGIPIGRRIDLGLYHEDPIRYDSLTPEQYDGGVSFNIAIEGTALVQSLEDPDQVHSTVNEWGWAAMMTAQLKWNHLRVHLEGIARSLSFITYDVPGVVPYQALQKNVETKPDLFGALSVDYTFAPINLTLAVTAGIQRPAVYKGVVPAGQYVPESTLSGEHTVVMRSAENWDILPTGEEEMPVFYGKFDIKWTFGKNFAALAELTYGRDPNLTQVIPDFRGHAIRTFDDEDILGFGLLARLNF